MAKVNKLANLLAAGYKELIIWRNHNMRCSAIVLAAGKGSRMNSNELKQFMDLQGYPLVYYSLQTFEQSCVDEIILVTGEKEEAYCRTQIIEKYHFQKVNKIVPGGSERYLSVYQGLLAVEDADIVLIHDGARPFVDCEIIERTIWAAQQFGSGIAAMPVKDTIKIANEDQFAIQTPDRNQVWMMQTPQTFAYPKIRAAYDTIISRHQIVTDDAMALELAFGTSVKLVEGSYRNIKVTTPEDLTIALALMECHAH